MTTQRVGAALVVVAVWAVVGMAHFSGKWDFDFSLLPSPEFEQTQLELIYAFYETWEMSLLMSLDNTPVRNTTLRLKGMMGEAYISGAVQFDYLDPAYKSAQVDCSWDWEGISLSVGATHWAPDYAPSRPCLQTGSAYIQYSLQVTGNWGNVLVRFEDCCQGVKWEDLSIRVQDLSLCCGMTVEGDLRLTKEAGFDSLQVWLRDVAVCPDCLLVDFGVKFTVSEKSLSVSPKLDFPDDLCFTLYGSLETKEDGAVIEGIRVQGFKVLCQLSGCESLEFETAFTPGTLGFSGDEFEYVKLTTCLPGCCGEEGLEITAYFSSSGGQFGLSRLLALAEVPLVPELLVRGRLELPVAGSPQFELGWTLEF